jgi:hypothetical protein
MKTVQKIILFFTISGLVFPFLSPPPGSAERVVNGPVSHSFQGRRGVEYTAAWDSQTYEVSIATPDGSFPWDWISFVGQRGAVALAGHPQVHHTFAFSDASALSGLQKGDVMRVKAWDNVSLAHLTKIGLVIGSGAGAQRAWLGEGSITGYLLAPDFIGYRVELFGRNITVRLSHLQVSELQGVGVVSVTIDNPEEARFYFASDLEPSDRYQQAVEFRNTNTTLLSFEDPAQAIKGVGLGNVEVYLYSSSTLLSWSANNLVFTQYLSQDNLDRQVLSGQSDGRVAITVEAEYQQYFFIGNHILSDTIRSNPAPSLEVMREARLSILSEMPRVEAPGMPGFDFVNIISNLLLTYLVNPQGNIFYTDKVFPYTADNLMALTEFPEILPQGMMQAYRDYLEKLGEWQYTHPTQGKYWWRADVDGNPSLPDWYTGNIPENVFRDKHGHLEARYQYSDLFGTAEYLISMGSYYRYTENAEFVISSAPKIRAALIALKNYNAAYAAEYGSDGHLYPHLQVPMGDLFRIEGVYPSESAMAIYAYEEAALLLSVMGDNAGANDLLQNFVTPMKNAYDSFFWNPEHQFFLPQRDKRSSTGSGGYFRDFWVHTIFPVLTGDIGKDRLDEMLLVYTSEDFLDIDNNFRWLSVNSENFMPDVFFTPEGYVMEGGFFNGAPNVAVSIAYYQLGQGPEGDAAAQEMYFDVWTRMGPYETMRLWSENPPGLYLEASIYVEPLISTLWLLKEALRVEVNGTQAFIAPVLGGEFRVSNLHLTSQGKRAVIDYWREANGCEFIQVHSNSGLILHTPQVGPCDGPPTPTPTRTSTPTRTATPTNTPTPTQTNTPAPTATPTPPAAGEYKLFVPMVTKE